MKHKKDRAPLQINPIGRGADIIFHYRVMYKRMLVVFLRNLIKKLGEYQPCQKLRTSHFYYMYRTYLLEQKEVSIRRTFLEVAGPNVGKVKHFSLDEHLTQSPLVVMV